MGIRSRKCQSKVKLHTRYGLNQEMLRKMVKITNTGDNFKFFCLTGAKKKKATCQGILQGQYGNSRYFEVKRTKYLTF
jgi:hypothetical protein